MDNRILVAAARGARLQYKKFGRGPWETTLLRPSIHPIHDWRVHPDDTELLYSKVGRALRKAAENPPILSADWIGYRDANTETRRMFLLMLAEELSYEVLE